MRKSIFALCLILTLVLNVSHAGGTGGLNPPPKAKPGSSFFERIESFFDIDLDDYIPFI